MRFETGGPIMDYNPNKPAKRHEEVEKRTQEEKMEEAGISRREFIKKGLLAGAGLALGVKVLKNFADNSKHEGNESAAEIIISKKKAIKEDLDFMLKKMEEGEIDAYHLEKLRARFDDFKRDFDEIERIRKQGTPESLVIEKVEKLEKEVSLERVDLEYRLHLRV